MGRSTLPTSTTGSLVTSRFLWIIQDATGPGAGSGAFLSRSRRDSPPSPPEPLGQCGHGGSPGRSWRSESCGPDAGRERDCRSRRHSGGQRGQESAAVSKLEGRAEVPRYLDPPAAESVGPKTPGGSRARDRPLGEDPCHARAGPAARVRTARAVACASRH